MGLYAGGFIIGRIFASEIWGLISGRAYFWGGLIIGLIIGISQYVWINDCLTQGQIFMQIFGLF